MIRAVVAGTVGASILLSGGTAVAGLVTGFPPGPGDFVKPVDRSSISQPFGCTVFAFEPVDPHCPGGHWHSGIDLAAARGTAVRATLSGVASVIAAPYGYGLHVVVDHGNGLTSLYAHLDSVAVASGSWVDGGQVIGSVGASGNATGPHLHFEVRRDGVAEDPMLEMVLP